MNIDKTMTINLLFEYLENLKITNPKKYNEIILNNKNDLINIGYQNV